MGVEFINPEFEVVRNDSRCIACRVCERQWPMRYIPLIRSGG